MHQKIKPLKVLRVDSAPRESVPSYLYGFVFPGMIGACCEVIEKTGNPEEDRWRGLSHDYSGPTFIRMKDRAEWDRHARALQRIIKRSEVKAGQQCGCRR